MLAEAVSYSEGQLRRTVLRVVERDGQINDGLSSQVVGSNSLECFQRDGTGRRIHHDVGACLHLLQ